MVPMLPFGLQWSCMVHLGPSNGPQWTLMVLIVHSCILYYLTFLESFLSNQMGVYNLFDQPWSCMVLYGPTGSFLRCISTLKLHKLTHNHNSQLMDTLLTLKFLKAQGLLTYHFTPNGPVWSLMVLYGSPLII